MLSGIYYFLIILITIIVLYTLYYFYSTPSIDTFSGNIQQDTVSIPEEVIIPEGDIALWMDAADPSTITLNTYVGYESISSWKDKSTNNYIFSQENILNQPIYKTNSQNNNNVVSFTREKSQYLGRKNDSSSNEPKNLSIGKNNLSMFVVVKIDNISNYNSIFNKASAGFGPRVINPIMLNRIFDNFTAGVGNYSIHSLMSKVIKNKDTSYQLIEVILNRQEGKIEFYINGILIGVGTFSIDTSDYDNNYDMIIGGFNNETGSIEPPQDGLYLSGDICEMLFYTHPDTLLNSSRLKVENYLKNKWNINIDTFCSNIPLIIQQQEQPNSVVISDGNIALWMDGADSSTITLNSNGKSITNWRDKSKNNYNFSQCYNGFQPTYEKYLNNNKIVSFAKENYQFLGGGTTFPIGTDNLSMFAVVKIDSTLSTGNIFSKALQGFDQKNSIILGRNYSNLSAGINNINQIISLQNTEKSYQLIEVILDREKGNIELYINGSPKAKATFTKDTTSNYDNNYNMIIGGSNNTDGKITPPFWASYFGGDICEMLFYTHSTALSETSRKKVENYLKNKWAVY